MDETKRYIRYYSYVIAAACFSIQAIGIGTSFAFGVFFNPLIDEFGWSRAIISGASSSAFFLMGLLGIFVGRLNDRIGPRKEYRRLYRGEGSTYGRSETTFCH